MTGWLPSLGGSRAVISGVINPLIRFISIVTLPITLLITTHEPPSLDSDRGFDYANDSDCQLDASLHVLNIYLNPKP